MTNCLLLLAENTKNEPFVTKLITVTLGLNMITSQNDPIFLHLLFELHPLIYFISTFKDLQNSDSWGSRFALCTGL